MKKHRLVFSKKFLLLLKIVESRKVALQGQWKCKNSQNVQKVGVFLKKVDGFFWQKSPIFQKIDEGSKFPVERDWISKNSQNVQVLSFLKKKRIGFQKETIFLKIVELSKISVEGDWISDFFQYIQKLRFGKQDWLFGKNLEFRWKQLKAFILMQNATNLVSFL